MSRVCIMSLWRNDADRNLKERARHLLSKTSAYHDVRWLWITGDNDDDTHGMLDDERKRAGLGTGDVEIIVYDSGIVGEDVATRRRRGSDTATVMFGGLRDGTKPKRDDFAVLHESDIQSPPDLVDRLLYHLAERGQLSAVAAWPVMDLNGRDVFYDTWAFRNLKGERFQQHARPCRGITCMEVSSFGTVWLAPAFLVRDRTISELCVVDLCSQWKCEGVKLWAAADVVVRQPADLWVRS